MTFTPVTSTWNEKYEITIGAPGKGGEATYDGESGQQLQIRAPGGSILLSLFGGTGGHTDWNPQKSDINGGYVYNGKTYGYGGAGAYRGNYSGSSGGPGLVVLRYYINE